MNNILDLPRDQANRMVSYLRRGVPPEEGIELFSVGRKNLLDYFTKKFIEIKDYGVSDIKFINADWGQGKSHFLDLLRTLAFKYNFVVSKVELHSREVPFDQLPLVIQRMMANILTPEVQRNGLEHLINEWSDKNKSKSEQDIFRELQMISIFPEMRMKLVEYRNHSECSDYQQCLQILKWFEGKETRSRTSKDVREYINSFVIFIRSLGYSGFIVMLDEAEAITSLSRINKRDLANENIRQIIDNDLDTQGFYFVFASIPTFLSGEDERGAQTYQALWKRISDPLQELEQHSLHKVIIELPKLKEEEFCQLAQNIKSVYEVATGRDLNMINENHLRTLAHYVQSRTDQRVGTMVRSTITILDEAANPDFDFINKYKFVVEKTIAIEARDRAI